MRPSVVIISLLSTIALASSNELNTKLSSIDLEFQQNGPSLALLDNYDVLIKEINTAETQNDAESIVLLGKIYYKKALLELSLGKDLNSIDNFIKSLEINPANPVVKKNLLDICIKYGLKDRILSLQKLFKADDEDYSKALENMAKIDELVGNGDLTQLNEAINISPADGSLRSKRIDLTVDEIKKNGDSSKFLDLVDDMTQLIKSNPINNLNFINELSEIYLFGLLEFTNALNFNKKCLHYDFDNSQCKQNSKLLNKYSPILSTLSEFHKYFQYIEETDKSDEAWDIDDENIKDTASKISDPSRFLKIRRENEKFKTNYDYLLHKSKDFNKRYNLKANNLQLTMVRTLVFDGFLRQDKNLLRASTDKLKDLAQNPSNEFLPIILANVDTLLSKNQFDQAAHIMEKITQNGRHSHHYTPRAQKINAYQRQRQQQQHQQHQQQRQRQQQQYQQQQQQQRQRSTPKNDYYKILEIPRDADQTTIRKAYREKTKQFHPDKYRGDLSDEEIDAKMAQINGAYEVLSDDELKRRYDSGDDPNDHEQPGGARRGNPFQGAGNPFGNGFNFMNFGNQGNGGFKFSSGGGNGYKFKDNRRRKQRS